MKLNIVLINSLVEFFFAFLGRLKRLFTKVLVGRQGWQLGGSQPRPRSLETVIVKASKFFEKIDTELINLAF